ncbi:non-structural maintenance of chromosomes element 4 homolog A-like [Papaver somniferum]|uniref:non-structural maintenance of chromosomes element 4 homolog A-like n=1 Tax=Papaver somniferum TaxID=3469 RepID=UPI000E6F71A6|nr:non-structural maintenance of chromosomes element 4 homolog A-like [Papaver somniferum]
MEKRNSKAFSKEEYGLWLERRKQKNKDILPTYEAVQTLIQEESTAIDNFEQILNEVERLHELAATATEQVLDAKALLDFVNKLLLSIKSSGNKEISPASFITGLLTKYGDKNGSKPFNWSALGENVVGLCNNVCRSCSTMVGPLDVEMKTKKVVSAKRKRSLADVEHPEELKNAATEEDAATDKNVAIMFNIMKSRKKPEKVENLIMNKDSYAQTGENMFALSFLVKDGRAEVKIDSNGHQVVSLRNAPHPDKVKSGEVQYSHFVFRLDFKDWEKMRHLVAAADEVMPHRQNPAETESAPPCK